MFTYPKQLSIKHIAVICFLLVGVVPLMLLGWKNIQHESVDTHREVKEKHQLLAQNLTFAISAYLEHALSDTKMLANKYSLASTENPTLQELNFYPRFLSIAILKNKSVVGVQSIYQTKQNISRVLLPNINCLSQANIRKQAFFSSIFTSPYSKKPTMFVCQPIEGKDAILLAELDLSFFYALQKSIIFGRDGHAAIVNSHGQIVAHPNESWVSEIKNVSDWQIIQSTKAGKTGTMKFFSPHFDEEMISGYAGIPKFEWGVIIPQPMSEVNGQIDQITFTHLVWILATLALALVLAAFFARKVTLPIISLSKAIAAVENNNFEGVLREQAEPFPKEIVKLSDSFKKVLSYFQKSSENLKKANLSLSEEINKATNDLLVANIKLQRIVTLDELTNMYNRRGLQDILRHEVARVKRDGGSFTILLCDLDHFKMINDNYGHAMGDNVLRTFSTLSQSVLRERDIVGRWGGEEFLCILGDADINTSLEIAERLRTLVEDTVILPDEIGFNVTVSSGLATFPTDGDDIDELIACADSALYEAKRTGRNKIVTCKRKHEGFQSVSNQLRCALAEDAIRTAFQSIFDVSTNNVVGKRVMTRIVCEKDKILNADVFLSTAKQLKLINHIDHLCLEATLDEFAENKLIYYIMPVSLEFLEKSNNLNEISDLMMKNPQLKIIIEISESEFQGNVYEARKTLKPYLKAGVQLCLNDFCSTGNSLMFLTELPFYYVKVNEDLLNSVHKNNRTLLAVRSALRMCKSLGIKTIASKVSDDKQLIKQLHFDWAYGYAYDKPILKLTKDKTVYV